MELDLKNESPNRWIKRVVFLSWFTIIYNLVEGLFSVWFGVKENSIALAGFGFDSFIEVGAALLILWRYQDAKGMDEISNQKREVIATKGIAILFLILALSSLLSAGFQLINHKQPETTLPGTMVSLLSLSFMFYLWRAKLQAAEALQSKSVKKDADCSQACIKLSVILLLGSLLFLLFPSLWWADSVAAVLLSFLIGKEGWETYQAANRPDFAGGCGCHQSSS